MEVVRPILFSSQFKAYHGVTPEQALSGMAKSSVAGHITIHQTPEEYDEHRRGFLRSHNDFVPYREHMERVLSEPVDIPHVLRKYRSGPSEVGVGNPLHVANELRALTDEMSRNSRVNDRPLYRGAVRDPYEDADRNQPVSFSERRGAANAFARSGGGHVFKAPTGTVYGIRMADYGVKPMTVGPRQIPEDEWLIDPASLRSSF